MSKFKVGDRVRFVKKSSGTVRAALVGSEFTLGDYSGSWDGEETWSAEPSNGYRFKASELELVQPASPSSPVRTVTRKEIVPGEYRGVVIEEHVKTCVHLHMLRNTFDKFELREAARIFNELADALEA